MNTETLDIPVSDPLDAAGDARMPSLLAALDPARVQRQLNEHLTGLARDSGPLLLRAVQVLRHKPGRRCVVRYDIEFARRDASPQRFALIGKVRASRSGKSGYRLLRSLWEAGFDTGAPDGIRVPEPVGTIPEFRMWLQREASGRVATDLMFDPGGERLVRRIAEAAHKLHGSGVTTKRRHTMADELRVLHERLPSVAREEPRWTHRIQRLLAACDQLGETVPEPEACGIHRDFYADQVIVDGERLSLIDFDLYCEGDPALDIGNFLGHMTEQSLRETGDPETLGHLEWAMEERFVKISGEERRAAVKAYATLTLVRHVHLSTLFPERRHLTGDLLELCEARMGAGC